MTRPTCSAVVRVVHGPDVGLSALVAQAFVVGRGVDPLALTDARVSRRHLQLSPSGTGVTVTDLQSASGTTVRGRSVVGSALAQPGDTIELGATVLRVLQVASAASSAERSDFQVLHSSGAHGVDDSSGTLIVGREPQCDVVIDAQSVSRRHAVVVRDGNTWTVTDERSSNGTFVNGQRVVGSHRLSRGDVVTFGQAETRLVYAPASAQGDVRVRLGEETDVRRFAITISAPIDATVADVTAQCVSYLGLPADESHLLIRTAPGLIMSPTLRWIDSGILDGEEIVVAVGEVPDGAIDVAVVPTPSRTPVNQLPRLAHRPAPHSVRAPDTPDTTKLRGRGLLWQVVGGVVAICGGLALALVRPEYLIFGLIMAIAGISSVIVSIASDQARRRRRMDDFRRRIEAIDRELDGVCVSQTQALRTVSPEDGELSHIVSQRTTRLWERRLEHPDVLMLRLGTGRCTTALTIEQPSFQQFGRHEGHEFDEVIARHRLLTDVPVCLPGLGVALVGMVGPRQQAHDAVGRLIVEAAALHPPDQLRIWILTDTAAWDWSRWLPHVADDVRCSVARSAEEANAIALELLDQLDDQPRQQGRQPPSLAHLVIVLHDALRLTNVATLLRRGVSATGQIIAVADEARELPSGIATLVSISADGTAVLEGQHPDPPVGPFTMMGTPLALSSRLGREFASMTLAKAAQQTGSAGLVELATGSPLGQLDVAASWARRHATLAAPIGLGDDGSQVVLDFRVDGPHGMIAGTTGSGKSELLMTLLAGLVLTHSPTELNLFLIDFKGGATFSPLAGLPHVVGVVTDLQNESGLATRAFTALDAEIERRKRLLDSANVPNIIDYERLPEAAAAPMPSLLVVIDEFALLVKQQPELRDRLDTVATQGRSLGVHLLLATQSPSGVITNSIRTNTNLWICLRVVSDAESTELLGRRDAARIPTERAGRGFVRKGASDSLIGFQAARIARDLDDGATSVVEIRPFIDERPAVRATPVATRPRGRRTTELEVAVQRIIEAFDRSGLPAATSLWSPPLPLVLDAVDVPAPSVPRGHVVGVIGTVDIPQQQRSIAAIIDLTADGHALVAGVLGSGRTTALRQLALDLAERYSPAQVHLYAIDAGAGSLADVSQLPHTAAVIPVGDEERLIRVISRLHRTMESRRTELTRAGVGNFVAWRERQTDPPAHLVVIIDDYATFRPVAEQIDGGRVHDLFTALVSGGPAVGIHLVVSIAQTNDLRMSHLNLIAARVVLRPGDSTDLQLIDERVKAEMFSKWPPGRGMVRGGHLVQVAVPTERRTHAVRSRWAEVDAAALPRPVERIPTEVDLGDIELPAGTGPRLLVLGVGGDDCDPVVIDIERGNGMLLIVGPNQSGRSTALRSAMASIIAREDDTVFGVITPRNNVLRAVSGHPRVEFSASTPQEITTALTAIGTRTGPPLVLLVDDAEMLPSSSPDHLEAVLRNAAESGVRCILAARTTDLQSLYEPWARYVQTQRFAIALQPGPAEAYMLGMRAAVTEQDFPPGRGLFYERGTATVVQVHCTAPATFSVP